MGILGAGPIYLGDQLITPPPVVLPDPYVWWDFSDTSTITDTGGTINTVADKSGNGFTLTGSGTVQTGVNTIGGLNVATFDGGYLNYNGSTGLNVGEFTVVVVYQVTTQVNSAGVLVAKPSSGNDNDRPDAFDVQAGLGDHHLIVDRNTNTGGMGLLGTGLPPAGVYVAALGIGFMNVSRWTSPQRLGGALPGGSSFSPAPGGWLLGGRYQSGGISGSFRLRGRVGEIRVYDQTLSLGETDAVSNHLAVKWGL